MRKTFGPGQMFGTVLNHLLSALILLPEKYCYQQPMDLGLVADAVAVPNAQGELLRGWFFGPGTLHNPYQGSPEAAPVVLFCPGTAGNLSSHLYYVELLCRAGCTVLALDYTGFGQSAGRPSLHTLVTDALCASDFLCRAKQVQYCGIFGVSLGANVALLVAAQRPHIRAVAVEGLARHGEIMRGILEEGIMGPRSVTSVVYEGRPPVPRTPHILNSWHVHGWLARALTRLGMAGFPFAGKDPRVAARTLTEAAVLCVHGVDDPLLPFEGTLEVYQALPGTKQLWLMPGVCHAQEPVLAQDGEYVAQLAVLFQSALTADSATSLATPPLTHELVPQGPERWGVKLRNTGPPGLILVTVVNRQQLASRTIWVQDVAEWPGCVTERHALVSSLRLCEVDGTDTDASIRHTARGSAYQATFQPLIRELSRILHERQLHQLDGILRSLPSERPAPPFDFFLSLYCIQIIRSTRRTMPHIAQMAAQAFLHYWPYGQRAEQPGHPTLWDLAWAVLDPKVS